MATINNEPFDIGAEALLINEESPYTEETEPPITMEDLREIKVQSIVLLILF